MLNHYARDVYEAIARVCNHSATIMEGEGSYEHRERKVVYSVISSAEIKKVMKAIKEADPMLLSNVMKTEQLSGRFYQKPTD